MPDPAHLPRVIDSEFQTEHRRHRVRYSNGDEVYVSSTAPYDPYQVRVREWMLIAFGIHIARDRAERRHRFLEEALELIQSLDGTAEEAHQLVDYVFGRAKGEPSQEVGGTMVTLAALCLAEDMDMHHLGDVELDRIMDPETMRKIRAKQAAKPAFGPLPGPSEERA